MDKLFFTKLKNTGIALKINAVVLGLIILSLSFYLYFSIPYQESTLLKRMNDEANDVASSFIEANKSALITDDYQLVVDYSNNTIKNSNSIKYIVVTKNNGTSLQFQTGKWDFITEADEFWLNPGKTADGKIINSSIMNNEVYHYSKRFVYTGIEWGWIHIGLSTESYNKASSNFMKTTLMISIATIIISFIVTFFFTRKLTKPISDLALMTRRIESGDLSSRVNIQSTDELGMLSESFNKMTDAVSRSKEELEKKVQERTIELAKTNIQLKSEIEERKKTEKILNQYTTKLQTLEEIYKGIISSKLPVEIMKNSSQKIYDNIIKFSRSSAAVFDYTNGTAVLYAFTFEGNHIKETEESFSLSHFSSVERLQNDDYFVEYDLPAKMNKSDMETLVSKSGINSYICVGLKFQGQLIGELNFAFSEIGSIQKSIIDTILEISNQIAVAIVQLSLEEKLKQHADDLQNSLREKEVLLKEIHHRVKNNLQIITSLLYLQSVKIEDNATQAIFLDSQNRVKSLALVHEKLYQSKDFARIDFSDYLKNLTNFIFATYKTNIDNLNIDYDLDEVYLSVEISVPLGLIVNELLSNSLKYAFNGSLENTGSQKKITLRLKSLGFGKYSLVISDNGKGLPDNFSIEENDSLGLKLVTSLINQIDGVLDIHPKDNTEFKITFSTDT